MPNIQEHFHHYANLKSQQGRHITVEYFVTPTPNQAMTTYAANVIVHVEGDKDDQISAVLVNRFYIPGDEGLSQDVYTRTLKYENSGFISPQIQLVAVTKLLFNYVIIECKPQIAVVINGEWQIDSWQPNEAHNFNFAWIIR